MYIKIGTLLVTPALKLHKLPLRLRSERPAIVLQSDFRPSVLRVDSGMVEWNWDIRVNTQSSGLSPVVIPVGILCCTLNVLDSRVVTLGRASRSGL